MKRRAREGPVHPPGQAGGEVPGFSAGADAVLEAPAFVSSLDDVTMMGEPVEKRRRHLGVAEDAGPFAESELCRHRNKGTLIEAADQVEQQLATGLSEWQITELIENEKRPLKQGPYSMNSHNLSPHSAISARL